MESLLLTPSGWEDYELVDSGNFEKLERFGHYLIRRPEPQALWNRSLAEPEWDQADAVFWKDRKAEDRGQWKCRSGMPSQWNIHYQYKDMRLTFRLGLTAFKHVGIFPEQAENWNYIYDRVSSRVMNKEVPKILNLFAYTGGASLAAMAAGAQVTHVDSVKQVISWARENLDLSRGDQVRWIVDDARKFVAREVKRGNRYDGIILDPPAYGRGPEGEKWVLEEDLLQLLENCAAVLNPNGFVVLNLYSMGLSALLASGLLRQVFNVSGDVAFGELFFADRGGKALPLGVFARIDRMP